MCRIKARIAQHIVNMAKNTETVHSNRKVAAEIKSDLPYYNRHVFICENRRDNDKQCCAVTAETNIANPVKFLREHLREKQLHGAGKVRVNRAGCFDRCPLGPVLVVYPDSIWYRYETENDLSEIAKKHLIDGEIVNHLRLPDTHSTIGRTNE